MMRGLVERFHLLLVTASCLVIFVSGCAAKLEIFEADSGSETGARLIKGVPFRVPTPYLVEGQLTKLETGGECDPLKFKRVEFLPSIKLYYASGNPDVFAESKFSMSLDDKGNLKEISVNSKPASSEALGVVKDIIFEWKKLIEARQDDEGVQFENYNCPDDTGTRSPCNTGEVIYKVEPLDKWESFGNYTREENPRNGKSLEESCLDKS